MTEKLKQLQHLLEEVNEIPWHELLNASGANPIHARKVLPLRRALWAYREAKRLDKVNDSLRNEKFAKTSVSARSARVRGR